MTHSEVPPGLASLSAEGGHGESGPFPHAAQQPGHGCAASRASHELDGTDHRYIVVDPLSEPHRKHPDLGDSFSNAIAVLGTKRHTAIPRTNSEAELDPSSPNGVTDVTQFIANTATFHFAFIEQGGTSLYAQLAHESRAPRCCAFCSVSAEPKSRISRPGTIRQETHLHSRAWLIRSRATQ